MIDIFSDPYDSLKTVKYLTFMNWTFLMGFIVFRISIISRWVQTLKCPSPRVAAAMHREGVEMEMRGRTTIPGSLFTFETFFCIFQRIWKILTEIAIINAQSDHFQHRGNARTWNFLLSHRWVIMLSEKNALPSLPLSLLIRITAHTVRIEYVHIQQSGQAFS